MNKICTSLEQSKKLVELGIDVNTADMCWTNHLFNAFLSSWRIESTPPQEYKNLLDRFVVRGYLIEPAWSLTALLKFIKSEIYGETIYGDTITYKVDFRKYKLTDDVDLYQIAYGSIKFDVDGQHSFKDMVNTGQKEDPIDAAFQMVCWLKENKKL